LRKVRDVAVEVFAGERANSQSWHSANG
jgi:hypothetical protein